VTCALKAGVFKPRYCMHDKQRRHATKDELLEAVFSYGPFRCCIERIETQPSRPRESLIRLSED
jgi:hypothetical protein